MYFLTWLVIWVLSYFTSDLSIIVLPEWWFVYCGTWLMTWVLRYLACDLVITVLSLWLGLLPYWSCNVGIALAELLWAIAVHGFWLEYCRTWLVILRTIVLELWLGYSCSSLMIRRLVYLDFELGIVVLGLRLIYCSYWLVTCVSLYLCNTK